MSFAMFFNFVSNRTASAYREYATLTYTYIIQCMGMYMLFDFTLYEMCSGVPVVELEIS